ncbi:MAG TPA: oligoendopeptidase F, partial [Paenisporosarcina sp.]|nr:oligoendopeptidase F [Paenisporosarcina sp.]
MTLVKSLPTRSEVTIEETWNLQDLFTSEESYQSALVELEKEVDAYSTKFKGSIKDAQSAEEALTGYAQIYER